MYNSIVFLEDVCKNKTESLKSWCRSGHGTFPFLDLTILMKKSNFTFKNLKSSKHITGPN
jgi:hypothetical protein